MAHIRWYNAEVQYALDLAREMVRRGCAVEFFAQEGAPGAGRSRSAGLPTTTEAGFNAKGWRSLAALAAAARLVRTLRRGRFDAVEVHRPEGLPLIAWACRRARVPVIRVRGDMRPVRSDPLNRLLYSRVLSAVVASNSAIGQDLRRRLGPGLRLVTIPGGVDPDEFTPAGGPVDLRGQLGFTGDTLLVGILGRLGEIKGHDVFLEAARRALGCGARARFVILVKEQTPREAELRQRVADDPLLKGRVGFVGNRADLPAVLPNFDLGVVASTGSEANCRVGLEWMASGVPLLATRVGVLPDLVRQGETGFLVNPADASALAENIAYLAARPEEARHLGCAARSRVLEGFTLAHCAAAHEALVRELVRR
jgi:glycosyltransferase involved in cell wall biosynthesis